MKTDPQGIKIFLRIRPPASAHQSHVLGSTAAGEKECKYSVEHSMEGSTIRFDASDRKAKQSNEVVNNSTDAYSFKFRRVFEPTATQEDVFNVVAKDCVQSVLEGYNSTVFAYGQTGSGKTYSITGGTESYDDRGIIPRALAMLYESLQQHKDTVNCTVSVSYLQIYNDKGQDLLNHGKDAKKLEDLPAVTVHEGADDITLKGLDQHYAPTLTDALNLLFLGDTNRMYCETPMNSTSSRSHCVFTVSLEMREVGSSAVRRSKLNLVDLAGSERVARSGVVGSTLTEAKYINLSLHYLEHVIVALSEQAKGRREHVPFRNSFMTMVLRDSLGGNCRTSMLATAHLARAMLPETLSTCQFAQRVALIRQNAKVNEELDPLLLVRKLKAEVAQLKDQLAFYEKSGSGNSDPDRPMTDDERLMCKNMVDAFLRNTDDANAKLEGFEGDLARVYYCLRLMRELVWSGGGAGKYKGGADFVLATKHDAEQRQVLEEQVKDFREQIDALHVSLQQKENETNMLLEVINKVQGAKFNATTQTDLAVYGSERTNDGGASALLDAAAAAEARQLATWLRSRSSGSAPAAGVDFSPHALSSATEPGGAASAATAATPTTSHTAAALTHLDALSSAGKVSEAQATAAAEYLRSKEQLHLLQQHHPANTIGEGQDLNGTDAGARHDSAKNPNLAVLSDAELVQNRAAAFEAFKQSYKSFSKVEASKAELKTKYETCKQTATQLNAAVDRMKTLKSSIQKLRAERAAEGGQEEADPQEKQLLESLRNEKEQYNALAQNLRKQKEEIDGIHAFMKRSQEKLTHDFEQWFEQRQRQVGMAAAVAVTRSQGVPPESNTPSSRQILQPLPTPNNSAHPAARTDTNRASYSGPTMSLHMRGAAAASYDGVPAKPSSAPQAHNAMAAAPPPSHGLGGQPSPPVVPISLGGLPPNAWVTTGPTSHSARAAASSGPAGSVAPLAPSLSGSLNHTTGGSAVAGALRHTSPNVHRLDPLPGNPASTTTSAGAGAAEPALGENPFAPGHRSTGNSAADAQLAELYRAREAMRQQFLSQQ